MTASTTAPPDRRRWLALCVVCAGMLMIVLDATVVNVALALLTAVVVRESTARNPLVPLRIFRVPNVTGASPIQLLLVALTALRPGAAEAVGAEERAGERGGSGAAAGRPTAVAAEA